MEKLGSVLQIGMTISIAASGPLLGMFTIGFLMPYIKPKAVFIGANVGLAAGNVFKTIPINFLFFKQTF